MSERYQERVYYPEIVKIYQDARFKISDIIKNLELDNECELKIKCDWVSMLYVVADYTALSINNRDIITNILHDHLPTLIPYCLQNNSHFTENPTFILRTNFYGEIIRREIEVRGECLLSDIPENIENIPVLRCAIAFCDILRNPALITNYKNAPISIIGYESDLLFTQRITLPIIDIISKFVADIIEAYKEEYKQGFEKHPQTNAWICHKCHNEISSYPCKYCSEKESEKWNTENTKNKSLNILDRFRNLFHL